MLVCLLVYLRFMIVLCIYSFIYFLILWWVSYLFIACSGMFLYANKKSSIDPWYPVQHGTFSWSFCRLLWTRCPCICLVRHVDRPRKLRSPPWNFLSLLSLFLSLFLSVSECWVNETQALDSLDIPNIPALHYLGRLEWREQTNIGKKNVFHTHPLHDAWGELGSSSLAANELRQIGLSRCITLQVAVLHSS